MASAVHQVGADLDLAPVPSLMPFSESLREPAVGQSLGGLSGWCSPG